jgi:hypothetical protein
VFICLYSLFKFLFSICGLVFSPTLFFSSSCFRKAAA